MKYFINLVSVFLVLLQITPFGQFSFAQKIHSITAWERGTYDDTIPFKAGEVIYNQNGKLLLDDHVISTNTKTTFSYDDQDRMTSSSYSYEDSKENCVYEYPQNNIIVKTCESENYEGVRFIDVTRDSLNKNGSVVTSYCEQTTLGRDSSFTRRSSSHFTYDKKGHEIYQTRRDENDSIYFWMKTSYYSSGNIANQTHGSVLDGIDTDDSLLFFYDEFDRLIRAKKYGFRRYDGKYLQISELTVSYNEQEKESKFFSLNDTIIKENLPYWVGEFLVYPGNNPEHIEVKEFYFDELADNEEKDLRYYYGYDDQGRLTSISGDGVVPSGGAYADPGISISYFDDDIAVENHCGENYSGSLACGLTKHYKDQLLTSWSYNSEWSFPFRITEYVYTYYE